MEEKGLNGREKIARMYRTSIEGNEQQGLFKAGPRLSDNPRMLAAILYDSVENVAQNYLLPMMEEGIADGSIQTDDPEELSEVLMLLANVWLNPMVFGDNPEKLVRKAKFYKKLTDSLGLHVIDDQVVDQLERLCQPFFDRTE